MQREHESITGYNSCIQRAKGNSSEERMRKRDGEWPWRESHYRSDLILFLGVNPAPCIAAAPHEERPNC